MVKIGIKVFKSKLLFNLSFFLNFSVYGQSIFPSKFFAFLSFSSQSPIIFRSSLTVLSFCAKFYTFCVKEYVNLYELYARLPNSNLSVFVFVCLTICMCMFIVKG
jgi:hypothetical protein